MFDAIFLSILLGARCKYNTDEKQACFHLVFNFISLLSYLNLCICAFTVLLDIFQVMTVCSFITV